MIFRCGRSTFGAGGERRRGWKASGRQTPEASHGDGNFPLLRGAERLPRPEAAAARVHRALRARGHHQAHDRGARRAAHRGRADPGQRRVGRLRARCCATATASPSTRSSRRSTSRRCCACASSRCATRASSPTAHLGGLARLLRMIGFDTLYDNDFADDEIERIARGAGPHRADARSRAAQAAQHHAWLLRARAATAAAVARGRRAARPGALRPPLHAVPALQRAAACRRQGPGGAPAAAARARAATTASAPATACGRVFWEGSHWQRMRALLDGAW